MFLHTNIQIKLNATVTATAAAYDAVVWHGKFTTLQKNNPQQYKNLGKKNQFQNPIKAVNWKKNIKIYKFHHTEIICGSEKRQKEYNIGGEKKENKHFLVQ